MFRKRMFLLTKAIVDHGQHLEGSDEA
jgi:hypothetical protein